MKNAQLEIESHQVNPNFYQPTSNTLASINIYLNAKQRALKERGSCRNNN